MNTIESKLWIEQSLEWFMQHWKWWKDYVSSTVLVDPSMSIIAYFDRSSNDIDVIKTGNEWHYPFLLECLSDDKWRVKVVKHNQNSKFEPRDYSNEIKTFQKTLDKIKRSIAWAKTNEEKREFYEMKEKITSSVSEDIWKHNRDYFINLIKNGV